MKNKILIIDDSASIRELVGNTLEANQYTVHKCINGQDALDFLSTKENKFNLIVSDINMPVMDGITFINEVRKNEHFKYTPILVLTTESQVSKKKEAKKAGATGWIEKPFDKQKFIEVVKKLTGNEYIK